MEKDYNELVEWIAGVPGVSYMDAELNVSLYVNLDEDLTPEEHAQVAEVISDRVDQFYKKYVKVIDAMDLDFEDEDEDEDELETPDEEAQS